MKLIASSVSARPNFVKLAAVHRALAARPQDCCHTILHTGQHYDPLLSDVFFRQLRLPIPTYNLGVKGSERSDVLKRTEEKAQTVLASLRPDVLLVYGDVSGALGAARAARALGIPIAHVEAGLRSFDASMPEEHNRIGIDRIARFLFCTEEAALANLRHEGVAGDIHLVGNTMIDTLLSMRPLAWEKLQEVQGDLRIGRRSFAVATIHRPSNVDDPMALRRVVEFLSTVAERCPVILPPHPRLKKALKSMSVSVKHGIPLFIEEGPRDYLFFLALMELSAFIITDSGGIQEEAMFLGKRCFTLRRNTERPSTIESGSNVLIELSKEEDRQRVLDYAANQQPVSVKVPPLWDGKAGGRIAELLLAS